MDYLERFMNRDRLSVTSLFDVNSGVVVVVGFISRVVELNRGDVDGVDESMAEPGVEFGAASKDVL